MVQTILGHVGDALGYAHRHGVINRAADAANLMLDEDGWAVVTDFVIAKVVQAEGLTMTGVTVGTPTYMSPEQCATREVTGASDQYSLGVVAYEMLAGRLPFHGDSTMSVMYAHFNERPRPVTELRSDCPPNLAAGVMRMLEKAPDQRWPSMDDVLAVCGRPSLRHDHPVRSERRTLALAGGRARAGPLRRLRPNPRRAARASGRVVWCGQHGTGHSPRRTGRARRGLHPPSWRRGTPRSGRRNRSPPKGGCPWQWTDCSPPRRSGRRPSGQRAIERRATRYRGPLPSRRPGHPQPSLLRTRGWRSRP